MPEHLNIINFQAIVYLNELPKKRDPKYAVVVFVENGRQGGAAAAPIFEEIGEKVIQMKR